MEFINPFLQRFEPYLQYPVRESYTTRVAMPLSSNASSERQLEVTEPGSNQIGTWTSTLPVPSAYEKCSSKDTAQQQPKAITSFADRIDAPDATALPPSTFEPRLLATKKEQQPEKTGSFQPYNSPSHLPALPPPQFGYKPLTPPTSDEGVTNARSERSKNIEQAFGKFFETQLSQSRDDTINDFYIIVTAGGTQKDPEHSWNMPLSRVPHVGRLFYLFSKKQEVKIHLPEIDPSSFELVHQWLCSTMTVLGTHSTLDLCKIFVASIKLSIDHLPDTLEAAIRAAFDEDAFKFTEPDLVNLVFDKAFYTNDQSKTAWIRNLVTRALAHFVCTDDDQEVAWNLFHRSALEDYSVAVAALNLQSIPKEFHQSGKAWYYCSLCKKDCHHRLADSPIFDTRREVPNSAQNELKIACPTIPQVSTAKPTEEQWEIFWSDWVRRDEHPSYLSPPKEQDLYNDLTARKEYNQDFLRYSEALRAGFRNSAVNLRYANPFEGPHYQMRDKACWKLIGQSYAVQLERCELEKQLGMELSSFHPIAVPTHPDPTKDTAQQPKEAPAFRSFADVLFGNNVVKPNVTSGEKSTSNVLPRVIKSKPPNGFNARIAAGPTAAPAVEQPANQFHEYPFLEGLATQCAAPQPSPTHSHKSHHAPQMSPKQEKPSRFAAQFQEGVKNGTIKNEFVPPQLDSKKKSSRFASQFQEGIKMALSKTNSYLLTLTQVIIHDTIHQRTLSLSVKQSSFSIGTLAPKLRTMPSITIPIIPTCRLHRRGSRSI